MPFSVSDALAPIRSVPLQSTNQRHYRFGQLKVNKEKEAEKSKIPFQVLLIILRCTMVVTILRVLKAI